jgi:tripartite ATP-independent periplasmic transporter solute receptor, DctP family
MNKKVITGVCLVAFVFSLMLAGCGNNQKPADNKKYQIRLGYILAPGSDADKGAQKFKEIVEKNSNGRIEVQTFPSSQLGSEFNMIDSQQMGSQEMQIAGDGPINAFEPAFGALTMPFAFRDIQHMVNVFNGPIGQDLNKAFIKDKNIRLLGVWVRGPRYLSANKEITSPADLQGYKMRVPSQNIYVETWKQLGAIPVSLDLSELYTALQQGLVGGQENPLDLINTSGYYQVQKYVMDTKHVYGPYLITMSETFYASLPDDLKKVVTDGVKEAGTYERSIVESSEDQNKAELEKRGMKFVKVDRQAFLDKLKGLPEKLEKDLKWIPGLYKQIIETK